MPLVVLWKFQYLYFAVPFTSFILSLVGKQLFNRQGVSLQPTIKIKLNLLIVSLFLSQGIIGLGQR